MSSEPIIKMRIGIPNLGSPEFEQYLRDWHAEHNAKPKRGHVTGRKVGDGPNGEIWEYEIEPDIKLTGKRWED